MQFINPGHLEKIRREEGFRNQEDIWDPTTLQDITEIITDTPVNIHALVDSLLYDETVRKFKRIFKFCEDLSEDFRKNFISLLEKYNRERRPISPQILNYLSKKNFILPTLTIADQDNAGPLLSEYRLFGEEIKPNNFLLTFQLPKPLAKFWWKGGNAWDGSAEIIDDTSIEWGHFYRELMPVVWSHQGCSENHKNLTFRRVNQINQHDTDKYYYIWEIS